jgi:type VI secretion system protein ImpG
MDPRLLKYYNRELQHVRDVGAEFAKEFPKIAGRLGLDGFECADPYVERLFEGFAFLAARVQLKLDAQFPRFTQHLLEMIYPHYLAPTPSMAVVQIHPDLNEGGLNTGFRVPRASALRSRVGKGDQPACEYRTSQDVTLWPLQLTEAEYFTRDAKGIEIPRVAGVKAGLRLRLRSTAGLTFDKLSLEELPIFLRGGDQKAMRLYEQLLGNALAVVVRPAVSPLPWQDVLPATSIGQLGFANDESLLAYGHRSFQGYRLLHEYFALPERFMFVNFTGLAPAVRRSAYNELDVIVLLDRVDRMLENVITPDDFGLFSTPAINLFPKRADRVHLTNESSDYHVVPDRTRPLDFEVWSVTEVVGYGATSDVERQFLPFYGVNDAVRHGEGRAYFTLERTPRLLSGKQRRTGPRSSYVGSEVYISLVDETEHGYQHDLRQLGIMTLCTNRDLPLEMPLGLATGDFQLTQGGPVVKVRCLAGPSRPKPPLAYGSGDLSWRAISHLTINYLSLVDNDDKQGAGALRDLLALYGEAGDATTRKQIEGLRQVSAKPITRRVPLGGPISFARGLEITTTLDESAFEGSGVFLLGAVLEQFFAQFASINSFTETLVKSVERGEVMRWPARIGRRHRL